MSTLRQFTPKKARQREAVRVVVRRRSRSVVPKAAKSAWQLEANSGTHETMSLLRTLITAVLLVALLPWGAYLGRVGAVHETATAFVAASVSGSGAFSSPPATAQKTWIKCRKVLPGSSCTTEAKAFLPTAGDQRPEMPRVLVAYSKSTLADGMIERPALRPPRLG